MAPYNHRKSKIVWDTLPSETPSLRVTREASSTPGLVIPSSPGPFHASSTPLPATPPTQVHSLAPSRKRPRKSDEHRVASKRLVSQSLKHVSMEGSSPKRISSDQSTLSISFGARSPIPLTTPSYLPPLPKGALLVTDQLPILSASSTTYCHTTAAAAKTWRDHPPLIPSSSPAPSASSGPDAYYDDLDVDVVGLSDTELDQLERSKDLEHQVHTEDVDLTIRSMPAATATRPGTKTVTLNHDIIDLSSDSDDTYNTKQSSIKEPIGRESDDDFEIIEDDGDCTVDTLDLFSDNTSLHENSIYDSEPDLLDHTNHELEGENEVQNPPQEAEAEVVDMDGWGPCLNTVGYDELDILDACNEAWVDEIDWSVQSDHNPIWDLQTQPLMSSQVVDQVTAYLVYIACRNRPASLGGLCLIPASLSGGLRYEAVTWDYYTWSHGAPQDELKRLLAHRSMVWTHTLAPQTVLIPIVDHDAYHCYLWYGKTVSGPENTLDLHLQLLDSMPSPGSPEMHKRFKFVKALINLLLPHINGVIRLLCNTIPNYRQAIGSTDCGFFVCQAVSAIAMNNESALHNLLPVADVRAHVFQILEQCQHGALTRIRNSYIPNKPITLHHLFTPAVPPWISNPSSRRTSNQPPSPQVSSVWLVPQIPRSLSEPATDLPPTVLSGGWSEVYGERMELKFAELNPQKFGGFLQHVKDGTYCAPPGMLQGVGGQIPGSLMKALLLEDDDDTVPWLPEARVPLDSDDESLEEPDGGLGLARFIRSLSFLQNGEERNTAIFTGVRHGEPLRLNWCKEPCILEKDWLTPGLTVDSISLTALNPIFTDNIAMHAYPPRGSTLTTDNGLSVLVNSKVTKLSHIPNFTFAHTGGTNPFRINVMCPHYEKGKNKGGRYITIMSAKDLCLWWEGVILQAVMRAEVCCPLELRHAITSLRQELPSTYLNAEKLVNGGADGRWNKGFPVIPEIFNLIISFARKIIDRSPRLARFHGFFFHIWGSGLKALGHQLRRPDGSALLYLLQRYPFVDWSLQNPRDIAVDVGVEINIKQEELPAHAAEQTLLWKLSVLKELIRPGWRKSHVDAYMHSRIVGGLSCSPRSLISQMFYHFHAYLKDKVITYRHRDSSIGVGFSPDDGSGNTETYNREITKLADSWKTSPGSYAVRFEWRCGIWGAEQILKLDPQLWVNRMLDKGAIVGLSVAIQGRTALTNSTLLYISFIQLAFCTQHIVQLKLTMLQAYDWFFHQIQVLSTQERHQEDVSLLAAVLHYLIHGLVKRPDEMSSSRFMAKTLGLIPRSIRYGFASISPVLLLPDLCHLSPIIQFTEYKIIQYSGRKNPAGARIKSSSIVSKSDELILQGLKKMQEYTCAKRLHRLARATAAAETSAVVQTQELGSQFHDQSLEDFGFLEHLINLGLAGWLWAKMPARDRTEEPNICSFQGPFEKKNWSKAVGLGVKGDFRPSTTGFQAVINMLFPANWTFTDRGKTWDSYKPTILTPILKRLEEEDPGNRAARSQELRVRIQQLMNLYEYLPCVQGDRLWSYTGRGAQKVYMLYRNPHFVRSGLKQRTLKKKGHI